MRTKQEILKAYLDKGADAKSDAHLSMLTVVSILEVLIDIRDEISVVKKDLVDLNEYLSEHA